MSQEIKKVAYSSWVVNGAGHGQWICKICLCLVIAVSAGGRGMGTTRKSDGLIQEIELGT